jgi:hypothetical protein
VKKWACKPRTSNSKRGNLLQIVPECKKKWKGNEEVDMQTSYVEWQSKRTHKLETHKMSIVQGTSQPDYAKIKCIWKNKQYAFPIEMTAFRFLPPSAVRMLHSRLSDSGSSSCWKNASYPRKTNRVCYMLYAMLSVFAPKTTERT